MNFNKKTDWIFFGVFSALGFLSKYLFIYLLLSFFIFFIVNFKNYKKSLNGYILSVLISLTLLIPHFLWLFENNFITIFYGLDRSGVSEFNFIDNLKNPLTFLLKQLLSLTPFFLMIYAIIKKLKFQINLKDKKILFLLSINLIPIILILRHHIIRCYN